MTNNRPNSGSTWEKIVSICLAAIVLGTFIFYVFNPPPTADGTLALIRFLAATFSGLAAFLFVGDLNLEGSIPGLNDKVKVRAAGGFAAFLLVFLLFFYNIQPQGNSNLPNSQPVTLWGSYPSLALFDPEEPSIPDILAEELEIDRNPVIFEKSPVFDSIQRFILETGNQNFIANLQNEYTLPLQYSLNYAGKTQGSFSSEEVNQTQAQFEQDSLIKDGDHGTARAEYSPILVSFSTDPEEANWTAVKISENTYDEPLITQYPKLSNIQENGLKIEDFLGFDDGLLESKDTWIRNVIEANPELRGLVGYNYKYIDNLSQTNLFPGQCETNYVVDTDLFVPYVKFIDVWNAHEEPIQLSSITYKIAFQENNPYQLRSSTQRSNLLKGSSKKTDSLNFTLAPGRHFFVPIEFGFQFNEEHQSTIDTLSPGSIYVPKPLTKDEEISVANSFPGFGSSEEEIQEYNRAITQEVRLDNDFLDQIKYSKNEIDIPHKLAIGSILDIESLVIDNRVAFTPKPADEFSSSIAQSLGLGSCPYLLVFNSIKGYWLELGTVLHNRASKSLQDTEIHGLSHPISKIKLQERENEITYLDYLAILYTEPYTNTIREVVPETSQLKHSDGQYLVLKKGEHFELDLSSLVPDNATKIELKVDGYYERI